MHSVVYRAWRLGCFSDCRRQVAGLGSPLAALSGGSDDLGAWKSGCRPPSIGRPQQADFRARPVINFPFQFCPSFGTAAGASATLFVLHPCQILISISSLSPHPQSCPDSDTQPPPLDQGKAKKGTLELKLGLGQNSDSQLPNSHHLDPAPLLCQPVGTFFTLDRHTDFFPSILPRKFYSFLPFF